MIMWSECTLLLLLWMTFVNGESNSFSSSVSSIHSSSNVTNFTNSENSRNKRNGVLGLYLNPNDPLSRLAAIMWAKFFERPFPTRPHQLTGTSTVKAPTGEKVTTSPYPPNIFVTPRPPEIIESISEVMLTAGTTKRPQMVIEVTPEIVAIPVSTSSTIQPTIPTTTTVKPFQPPVNPVPQNPNQPPGGNIPETQYPPQSPGYPPPPGPQNPNRPPGGDLTEGPSHYPPQNPGFPPGGGYPQPGQHYPQPGQGNPNLVPRPPGPYPGPGQYPPNQQQPGGYPPGRPGQLSPNYPGPSLQNFQPQPPPQQQQPGFPIHQRIPSNSVENQYQLYEPAMTFHHGLGRPGPSVPQFNFQNPFPGYNEKNDGQIVVSPNSNNNNSVSTGNLETLILVYHPTSGNSVDLQSTLNNLTFPALVNEASKSKLQVFPLHSLLFVFPINGNVSLGRGSFSHFQRGKSRVGTDKCGGQFGRVC